MPNRRKVSVIGAGPAGIMAALQAAEGGAEVALFDANPIVARKLLVTGNGRCNISNTNAQALDYDCDDPQTLTQILTRCGPEVVLGELEDLGIPTYATFDGWCYPLSDSAVTVADALETALNLAGVQVHLQTLISDIAHRGNHWALTVGGGHPTHMTDRVVIATGGKAHPALGSKGSFFPVLARLGHTVLPIEPALVSIEADMHRLQKLQGVRLDVGLSLYADGRLLKSTLGNMMFTQSGLSGPAAMNLSHLVNLHPNAERIVSIDLLAIHREALLSLIRRKRQTAMPLRVALGAVLPGKMPPVLLRLADLNAEITLGQLSELQLEGLLCLLGALQVHVKGTRGFQFAQLSTGGVPLREIDPYTMASRQVPDLYLAGELLNVVGPCGGYNLQFALATGMLAGQAAAK